MTFSGHDNLAVSYLKHNTSGDTSSFGNVDGIRVLWVGMDGEDLGGQGDGVAIFVGGLGLSAFLFGDRVPCHRVSADGSFSYIGSGGRSRSLEVVVGV